MYKFVSKLLFLLFSLTSQIARSQTSSALVTVGSTKPNDILVIHEEPCENCASDESQCAFLIPMVVVQEVAFQSSATPHMPQLIAPPISVYTPRSDTATVLESPTRSFSRCLPTPDSSEPTSIKAETADTLSTDRPIGTSTPTATTGITYKSSAETMQMHRSLYIALGLYTIAFTLILLPPSAMDISEFILVSSTCAAGWVLLYSERIISFSLDPLGTARTWLKEFNYGLLDYGVERWHTLQLIRHSNRRIAASVGEQTPESFSPDWKQDILKSLRTHDLHDYFNCKGLDLEAYQPPQIWPPTVRKQFGSSPHNEDDNFSSDEGPETPPLLTKLSQLKPDMDCGQLEIVAPSHGTTFGFDVAEESKETCVDETLSPREKVSGFISWDALKRDSEINAVESVDTEASQERWEREAVGAML